LVDELERTGVLVVPLPEHLVTVEKLAGKACQQYATADFATNVIVLDTGQAKLMTSYMPLHELRQVPGFERVRYEDPYSGTMGNSMRYSAMSPRDDTLQVQGGPANLWCCGEKAGLLVGHTEAMVTGAPGHNAVRCWPASGRCSLPGRGGGRPSPTSRADGHLRRASRAKYTFGFVAERISISTCTRPTAQPSIGCEPLATGRVRPQVTEGLMSYMVTAGAWLRPAVECPPAYHLRPQPVPHRPDHVHRVRGYFPVPGAYGCAGGRAGNRLPGTGVSVAAQC
jgi:hypothetical protein